MPDPTDRHPRRRIPALDAEMSYVSVGEGCPIVFLHGNPMWSYLWRNIIPYVSECGQCLAPDLVGMGASGPSPGRAHRFLDHSRYLDAWFDALELTADVPWCSMTGAPRSVFIGLGATLSGYGRSPIWKPSFSRDDGLTCPRRPPSACWRPWARRGGRKDKDKD
jgi:hypothetical protein